MSGSCYGVSVWKISLADNSSELVMLLHFMLFLVEVH